MSKLILVLMVVSLLVLPDYLYAAPVGNIATPSTLRKGIIYQNEEAQFAVVGGGEIDIIFDRKIKHASDDVEFNFYGGKIGILIMDRFMPYTVLGAGKAQYKFTDLGTTWKLETKHDFVWSIGGTAMLYETKAGEMGDGIFRIGVDGRYRKADLGLDKITVGGTTYKISDYGVSADLDMKEWQVALGLSYQIQQFIPYIGVKYSDLRGKLTAKTSTDETSGKFRADKKVGIFFGGDIVINDTFSANVEGRFIDETALSIGAMLRF